MKTKNNKKYAYVILILLCSAVFMPNYAQYQISAFGPALMTEANLSPTQFATIATAPLLPGIFLSLVSGLLVDRFGTRKIMTASVLISGLAVVLRLFSRGFWSLYLTMIFIGVSATCMNANAGKTLGQWFSPEKMSVGMGCFMALASGGMAMGTGTASLYSGMNGAFIGAAVIAVITIAAWILFMRDKTDPSTESDERIPVKEGLKVAVKSRTVWVCAVTMFLSIGAMTAAASFLPAALVERGMAESAASVVTMAITLGSLIGCFVCPSLFRFFKKQYFFFLCHGILAAFGLFIGWKLTDNPVILFIIMLFTGVGCNGFSPLVMSMPVQDKNIGTRLGGTAGGLLATLQLGGSVIIPTYIIAPIATTAEGKANYNLMFTLFGVMILLYLFMAFRLPNKKQEMNEETVE